MEFPVYLFTGFLEAGKTRLIQETMEDADFNAGEATLILLCEEGEEELCPESFNKGEKNIFIKTIETLDDINTEALLAWQKETKFRRVLIECNGMWQIGEIYRRLPRNFPVYQEIMVADATTFASYNANMRSLVVDKLQGCELVIFNRCPKSFDTMELHRLVRGISRSVNISYEYTDGTIEYDDIIDPLPFDIEADVITVEDRDFALFYRDVTEEMDKYHEKTVHFRALVAKDERLDKDTFVGGRQVMTCCVDDIAFSGFVCKVSGKCPDLKTGDWVTLTAKIEIEPHKMYRYPGPVLYVTAYEKSDAPEVPVATFY